MNRRIASITFAVSAMLVATTGCSGDEQAAPAARAATTTLDAIIIDVRTPEEFAAGHLDGAILVDIQNPSFDSKIAALEASADYIVYCRSGNRSAQAVERMRAAGFSNLTDLGSLENASAVTGVDIVRG